VTPITPIRTPARKAISKKIANSASALPMMASRPLAQGHPTWWNQVSCLAHIA
jgi:hypothetical protein